MSICAGNNYKSLYREIYKKFGTILVVISYEAGLTFSQIGLTLTYSGVTRALLVIILRIYYSRKL